MFNVLPTQNKHQIMTKIRILQGLPAKKIAEIDRISTLGRATKGHIFYQPETTSEFVFVLLEGHVHQYRINFDGRKIITTALMLDFAH